MLKQNNTPLSYYCEIQKAVLGRLAQTTTWMALVELAGVEIDAQCYDIPPEHQLNDDDFVGDIIPPDTSPTQSWPTLSVQAHTLETEYYPPRREMTQVYGSSQKPAYLPPISLPREQDPEGTRCLHIPTAPTEKMETFKEEIAAPTIKAEAYRPDPSETIENLPPLCLETLKDLFPDDLPETQKFGTLDFDPLK